MKNKTRKQTIHAPSIKQVSDSKGSSICADHKIRFHPKPPERIDNSFVNKFLFAFFLVQKCRICHDEFTLCTYVTHIHTYCRRCSRFDFCFLRLHWKVLKNLCHGIHARHPCSTLWYIRLIIRRKIRNRMCQLPVDFCSNDSHVLIVNQ